MLSKRPRWSVSGSKPTVATVHKWAVVMLAASLVTETRPLLPTTHPARLEAMISAVCGRHATPTSPCPLAHLACLGLVAAAAARTLALEATWFVAATIAQPAADPEPLLPERRKIRRPHHR